MRRVPHHLLALLIALPVLIGFFGVSPVQAQQPDDGRPYLELPFPGGRSYEVTCGYGCYQHKGNMSYGVDFNLPEGAPVTSAAAGKVMAVTWEIGLPRNLDLGDALIVYIDHGGGWFTRYIHLSALTVRVGDRVEMGQIIGYSGKTGASGAHLHFELRYGRALSSPSVPIDELFGDAEPEEGINYRSNNAPLAAEAVAIIPTTVAPTPRTTATTGSASRPPTEATTLGVTPDASTTPAPATVVSMPSAPLVAPAYAAHTPFLSGGISLSSPTIQAGDAVTVSFTILNPTEEDLTLATLGVMPAPSEAGEPTSRGLTFTRVIKLAPGERYTFQKELTVADPGPLTLIPFALGAEDEWLPLAGATRPLTVQVMAAPIYLPLVSGPVTISNGIAPTGVREMDK